MRGMRSPYVCLTCRKRISQLGRKRVYQWQARATFISLTDSPQTTTDKSLEEDLLELGSGQKPKDSRRPLPFAGQPPRAPRNRQSRQLESLFEQTVEKQSLDSTSTYDSVDSPIRVLQSVRKLQEILAENDLPAAWKFFAQSSQAWKSGLLDAPRGQTPRVKTPAWGLLRDIIKAKKEDPLSERLPSATEITRVYWELGILHGVDWSSLMLALLQNVPRIQEKVLEDIIGMWNIVCRRRPPRDKDASAALPTDWSQLPVLTTKVIHQVRRKHGLYSAFALTMPSLEPNELRDLPVLSVALFKLLKANSRTQAAQDAFPLTSTLASIITTCNSKVSAIVASFRDKSGPIIDFVGTGWSGTKGRAAHAVNSSANPSKTPKSFFKVPQLSRRTESLLIHKRLRDALGRSDVSEVDLLWADASKLPIYKGPASDPQKGGKKYAVEGAGSGMLTTSLYNYFILVYMALNQPDRAVNVWNHMVTNCVSPTLMTWDSMMMGCRKARNVEALEGVWSKMMSLGIKPNSICWTTRIRGLMDLNKIDQAMNALNEMGRLWLSEAQRKNGKLCRAKLQGMGDVDGTPKPTIETINAAITGVLRRRLHDLARQILAWADKFGLRPNIETCNALLQPLIRDGESEKARILLEQMQELGIEADIATFTTIIEETFRYSDDCSPNEQAELVDRIFAQIEPLGIKADLHLYGKIIFELLSNPNATSQGTLTAVRGVLDKMLEQGLKPTAYIHTMIVEHFFAQEPPDIPAVESLIERVKLEVGSVDHVFWDRIVEGYARVGDINTAVRILDEKRSGGSKVSWLTLRTVLAALVNNENWSGAAKLVNDARIERGGPIPQDQRGVEGQHAFWGFVGDLGLLKS